MKADERTPVTIDLLRKCDPVTVKGRVVNAATGELLVGASVGGDWGDVTTTGADGTYAFTNVPLAGQPAGGWDVHVHPPIGSGLDAATKNVTAVSQPSA